MRSLRWITLIVAILFCLSCNLGQNYQKIKVKRVIDGDTIELANGRHVRYIGIDSPETRKFVGDRWVNTADPFGEAAKEFNRQLVEGRTVRLEFDVQKKDKYNRLLAYCFTDTDFVNAKLLEEGYGLLYTLPPNVKYVDLFVKLQKEARQNNRGLWAADEVVSLAQASKFIGKVKTVEGKVLSVRENKKTIFLNFGKDHKTDFTAVIFKNNLGAFISEKQSPFKLKNKTVRIFGLIKEYNGPEIIIQDPSQIEVVE